MQDDASARSSNEVGRFVEHLPRTRLSNRNSLGTADAETATSTGTLASFLSTARNEGSRGGVFGIRLSDTSGGFHSLAKGVTAVTESSVNAVRAFAGEASGAQGAVDAHALGGERTQVYVWGDWSGIDDGDGGMILGVVERRSGAGGGRERAGEVVHAESAALPVPLQATPGLSGDVVQVACGDAHGIAVFADGCVCAWGLGKDGRLGMGGHANADVAEQVPALSSRWDGEAWAMGGGGGARQVACGKAFSAAVTVSGQLLVWGDLSWCAGEEGEVSWEPRVVSIPRGVGASERVGGVACGMHHASLFTLDGVLMTWGLGFAGQLGHGDTNARSAPCPVHLALVPLQRGHICAVSCGAWHSAALTEYGHLLTWGAGDCGQLGLGDKHPRLVPATVPDAPGVGGGEGLVVVAVACGQSHTIAVVLPWPAGKHAPPARAPTRAESAGAHFGLSGCVVVCGKGQHGQLGLGMQVLSASKFTAVAGVEDAVAVSAGRMVSAAITRHGQLMTWGLGACVRPDESTVEAAFEARKASARLTAGSDAVRQVACGGTWFAAVVARPGGEAGAGNEMMNELMWKGQEVDGVLLSAWQLVEQGVMSAQEFLEQQRQVVQSRLAHSLDVGVARPPPAVHL